MVRVLKPKGKLVVATWCQRDDTEVPFNKKERRMLDFLYSEWTHPYFVSIKHYVDLLKKNKQLKGVKSADWSKETIPSWRHSMYVAAVNPWPFVKR